MSSMKYNASSRENFFDTADPMFMRHSIYLVSYLHKFLQESSYKLFVLHVCQMTNHNQSNKTFRITEIGNRSKKIRNINAMTADIIFHYLMQMQVMLTQIHVSSTLPQNGFHSQYNVVDTSHKGNIVNSTTCTAYNNQFLHIIHSGVVALEKGTSTKCRTNKKKQFHM